MIRRGVPTLTWSYLHPEKPHRVYITSTRFSRTQSSSSGNTCNSGGSNISIHQEWYPAQTATPTCHDRASTPDDKFPLEPRWLCTKGMWVQGFRQAVGIRDLGCFLLTSWHSFCRERITWHCQRVINRFCNGMEKLGLRCFLQLVKKTSQSHEVQLICSIFKEPGWNKKTCYLETIQQSLYGRMIMVIFLDVINENV